MKNPFGWLISNSVSKCFICCDGVYFYVFPSYKVHSIVVYTNWNTFDVDAVLVAEFFSSSVVYSIPLSI